MSEARTISALAGLGEKVYVLLRDDETGMAFLRAAEAEGFTFGDGVKPTLCHYSRVMALHDDGTVGYVGAVGNMAFGAKAAGIVRIDYAAYLKGESGMMP
jgi:hypothetical protein